MPLRRREFIRWAGAAGAAALAPGLGCWIPAPGRRGDGRPNILFIMTDDHAYQAVSCYDGRLNRTPHIDRLARGGSVGATGAAGTGAGIGAGWGAGAGTGDAAG